MVKKMSAIKSKNRMLKWNTLFLLSFIVVLILAGCTSSKGASTSKGEKSDTLKIRIGSIDSQDSSSGKAIDKFRTVLEEELGDRVELTVYPNSQLGTYREMVEQIANDSLEGIYESIGILETWSPLAGIETIPYLYQDENHFMRIWASEEGQAYLDELAKVSGFRVVGPSFRGFRQLTVNKPIETASDLKGIKLRVPAIEAYANAWKTLGVSPTPVDFEETYTAIQQGLVVGQENPISIIMDHRFYEVADYLVLTKHMAETVGFIFNEEWYKQLNSEQKDAIEKAAFASAQFSQEETAKFEGKMIEEIKEHGVTVLEPDLTTFREQAEKMKIEGELKPWVERFRSIE